MEKISSCTSSELDLFAEQQYQNMIREGDWGYYAADLKINNQPRIDVPKSAKFFDLSNSFIAFVVKIYKLNGSNEITPTNSEKISLTNNFVGTAFKQIQIKLDDQEIENSNSTYAIEDYIKRTLNEPRDTKDTFLQNHCYYADSPSLFDLTEVSKTKTSTSSSSSSSSETKTESVVVNEGFYQRNKRILDGKGEVEVRGPISSALFNCGKFLLKQTKLTIVLTKNDDSFALIGDNNFKFKFVNCGLWVKQVVPNDDIVNMINERLVSSAIHYNTIKTKVSIYTFDGKTDNLSQIINPDNLIPNKLVVCFADNDAIATGNYAKNPFNFQNYNIKEIDLREGTSQFPYTTALTFDFENNKFLDGYWTLFNGIQKPSFDSHIDMNAYKNGYFFIAYDLRRSEDCPEYKEISRSGCLTLNVKFKEAINKPISIICYQEFNHTIKIQVKQDGSKIFS